MKSLMLAAVAAVTLTSTAMAQSTINLAPVVPENIARVCGQPEPFMVSPGTMANPGLAVGMEKLRLKLAAKYDAQCQVRMQQFSAQQEASITTNKAQAEADRQKQAEIERLRLKEREAKLADEKIRAEADRQQQAEKERMRLKEEQQRAENLEKQRKQDEADRPMIEERQRIARENEEIERKKWEEKKQRDEEAARIKQAQREREIEDGQRKQAEAQRQAEAEAHKPSTRLLQAYKAYHYVRFCSEVRQGYALVYINDVELERATTAIKAFASKLQKEDVDLDVNGVWKRAMSANAGRFASDWECKNEYHSLLQISPVDTFDNSRP